MLEQGDFAAIGMREQMLGTLLTGQIIIRHDRGRHRIFILYIGIYGNHRHMGFLR